MIIPSIDIQNGQTVQLIGGAEHALDAGDPMPLAMRFGVVGEIAVVDLDAALGRGDNRALIDPLLDVARCRVGGGIRDAESALAWLDRGATKVVIGTAAVPEVLEQLPSDRVIAALDARDGDVVVEGWQRSTGRGIEERMLELREHVAGFLVTFVEREGRMAGTDLARVERLVEAAGDCELTIAGGVTTASEVAALDSEGADAQIGMALYTQKLGLAEAFAAPLRSDRPDGLWPTVVVDEHGTALGLAYSSAKSLEAAIESRRGVYESRSRGLWEKGKSSGATQELLAVDVDCDRDTLRFVVRQSGAGFCHRNTWTCWGAADGLRALEQTMSERARTAPVGSYTKKLLDDPALLRAKLLEEAGELAAARTPDEVAWEAADVLYFTQVALARAGVTLADAARELDRRALRVQRRSQLEERDDG